MDAAVRTQGPAPAGQLWPPPKAREPRRRASRSTYADWYAVRQTQQIEEVTARIERSQSAAGQTQETSLLLLAGGDARRGGLQFDLRQHLHRFAEMFLEVEAHRVQSLHKPTAAQGIEDLVPFLASDDDSPGAQHRQMRARIGLLHTQPLEDGPCGDLSLAQHLDNGDA